MVINMKKLYITLRNKSNSIAARAKIALDSKRAEMYVDKGVGIIIAVVVGGVLLGYIQSVQYNDYSQNDNRNQQYVQLRGLIYLFGGRTLFRPHPFQEEPCIFLLSP